MTEKIEIIEENLPMGALPKYDVPINAVVTYLTPSKQFATVGPGILGAFTCPVLTNLTAAELKRFQMEILKANPSAISMRVIKGPLGWGLCCTTLDMKYKPPQPKAPVVTAPTVDLSTLSGEQRALWTACKKTEDDNQKPACGDDCAKYIPLQGKAGTDWGVCVEPQSPRVGLLTFKDSGCPSYEAKPKVPKPKPKPPAPVPSAKVSDGG